MIRYTNNKNLIFFMVVFAVAIGNAGSTLYLPALVTISHKLVTTNALVKLSLSCYLLTFGLSQLIYGPLSDAFGRRKILITGLFIFLIGSILASCANDIYVFLLGRLIEGIGIGAANAVGYALIRDIYNGTELIRKLSYLSMLVGLTPIIAPLCGGYLVEYFNWQSCFISLSVITAFLLLMQITKLPETNLNQNPQAIKPQFIIKNYLTLVLTRSYLAYILATSIGFSSLLCINAVLPFIMIKHLGVTPSKYGWLTLCVGSGYFCGSFVGGVVATKIGAQKTIRYGAIIHFILAIFGYVIASYAYNIPLVLLPLIGVAFSIGFIIPIGAGGAMTLFPQLAGSAAALLGAFMFSVSALFTSLAAHLSTDSQRPLFLFLIFLSCIAYLIITYITGAKKNV